MNPEIEAMVDVLTDLGEASDSMAVEDAVALHADVTELGKAVRELLGLIETQMVQVLESPVVRAGKRYEVVNDGKWRPDHMTVQANVIRAAAADEDGVLRSGRDAAEIAVITMYDLFVSAATMPKTGGLERLGLDKGDVARFEAKGKKVKVTIAEPDEVQA